MNHLMRPALYESYHHIVNISNKGGNMKKYSLCGNICESGDVLGWDRDISESKIGDIIAICTAGAYGFSMASNYNLREKPAEVLIT
jgi:diaminopimelate decarboxylase